MKQEIFVRKDKILLRLLLLCLGNLILGIGNVVCLKTGLGADSLNVLYQGTAMLLHTSEGIANLAVSAVMILATAFLDIHQLGIGTILAPFACTAGINLGMSVMPEIIGFPENYTVMLAGLIVIAFGIAISIYADYGRSAYDAVIFGFTNRIRFQYHQIRWGLDITFLAVGISLGGKMTPATIIAILITGKIVTQILHMLSKTGLVKNENTK